jgi:hypothetical protein
MTLQRKSTMKRIDVSPRRKNAPRPAEKSALGFLQWLRGRACAAVNFGACEGKIEAAHTYGSGDKGIGTKNSDTFAIPLCSRHHKIQHDRGWRTFEDGHGFGLPAPDMARIYWRNWPGRRDWEAKNERR